MPMSYLHVLQTLVFTVVQIGRNEARDKKYIWVVFQQIHNLGFYDDTSLCMHMVFLKYSTGLACLKLQRHFRYTLAVGLNLLDCGIV